MSSLNRGLLYTIINYLNTLSNDNTLDNNQRKYFTESVSNIKKALNVSTVPDTRISLVDLYHQVSPPIEPQELKKRRVKFIKFIKALKERNFFKNFEFQSTEFQELLEAARLKFNQRYSKIEVPALWELNIKQNEIEEIKQTKTDTKVAPVKKEPEPKHNTNNDNDNNNTNTKDDNNTNNDDTGFDLGGLMSNPLASNFIMQMMSNPDMMSGVNDLMVNNGDLVNQLMNDPMKALGILAQAMNDEELKKLRKEDKEIDNLCNRLQKSDIGAVMEMVNKPKLMKLVPKLMKKYG